MPAGQPSKLLPTPLSKLKNLLKEAQSPCRTRLQATQSAPTQEGVESAKDTAPAEEAGKAVNDAAGTASDYADAAKEATVGDAAAAGMPLQEMQHQCALKWKSHLRQGNCQN